VALISTAGRLLQQVHESADLPPREIAHALGVNAAEIDACRTGASALPLEAQMRLAALVATRVPAHARGATRLFEQARAALRVASDSSVRHDSYPRVRFR
jgi:hypothetical protein